MITHLSVAIIWVCLGIIAEIIYAKLQQPWQCKSFWKEVAGESLMTLIFLCGPVSLVFVFWKYRIEILH